eukprot:957977-Prymnesium_polylepis.1
MPVSYREISHTGVLLRCTPPTHDQVPVCDCVSPCPHGSHHIDDDVSLSAIARGSKGAKHKGQERQPWGPRL